MRLRTITPRSCSSARRVLSTVGDMRGRARWIWLKRVAPSTSSRTISSVHFSPSTSAVLERGQNWLYSITARSLGHYGNCSALLRFAQQTSRRPRPKLAVPVARLPPQPLQGENSITQAATATRPAAEASTEAVLGNHLQAARIGVDAIMQDYTDRSVL